MASKEDQTPDKLESTLQQATGHLQQGNLDKADELVRGVLDASPEHTEASYLAGLIAGQRGNIDLACQLIGTAAANNPENPGYQFNLALALHRGGRLEEALKSYEKSIRLNPDYPIAQYNYGILLRDLGRLKESAVALEKTIRLKPDVADVYSDYGFVLAELARYKQARDAYEQAARLQPENPQTHYSLGLVLTALGQPRAALAAYDQAIRIMPGYAEAHNNRGTLLKEMGRFKEAEEAFRQTILLKPDVAQVHNNLGHVLKELERPEEACEVLRTALELDPELASARYLLAALGAETTPAQSPTTFVADLFDGYANNFDNHLVDTLQYRSPESFFEIFNTHIGTTGKLDILDLGCGTGLCGLAFSTISNRLVGIDLSSKMLAKARERGLYTELIEDDVCDAMEKLDETFDLVLAGDVFVYIGDIEMAFMLANKRLETGGHFLLSIEANDSNEDYSLRGTGRYAQSPEYVRRISAEQGFEEITCKPVTLRYEQGSPIAGNEFLLRKINPGNSI